MALFGSLGQWKGIWLFRSNFGTILAKIDLFCTSNIKISKFYENFLLSASSHVEKSPCLALQASSYVFGHQVQIWTFQAQNIPNTRGDPNFLLAPQTLPTHRYSKLPLFLLEDFVSFLAWVKISIETCVLTQLAQDLRMI